MMLMSLIFFTLKLENIGSVETFKLNVRSL